MAGGRRSGRERKDHGSSPRAGEAIALARGLGSQPRMPVSVIQAPPAATASRNLRRVISVLNPLSLPLAAFTRCAGPFRADQAGRLLGGFLVLGEAWFHQLRGSCRSDRDHA